VILLIKLRRANLTFLNVSRAATSSNKLVMSSWLLLLLVLIFDSCAATSSKKWWRYSAYWLLLIRWNNWCNLCTMNLPTTSILARRLRSWLVLNLRRRTNSTSHMLSLRWRWSSNCSGTTDIRIRLLRKVVHELVVLLVLWILRATRCCLNLLLWMTWNLIWGRWRYV